MLTRFTLAYINGTKGTKLGALNDKSKNPTKSAPGAGHNKAIDNKQGKVKADAQRKAQSRGANSVAEKNGAKANQDLNGQPTDANGNRDSGDADKQADDDDSDDNPADNNSVDNQDQEMQNANDDNSSDGNSKTGKYRLHDTSGGNTTNQNSHQSPTPSIKDQKGKAKSQASQTARVHAKAKKQNPTKANGANKTGSRGMIKHRSNSTKPTGATRHINGNYNAETGGTAALNGIQHAGNGIQHVGNGITRLGGGNPSPVSKVNHGYDTNLDGSVGNAEGGVLGNNYDSLPTGSNNNNGTTTTSDVQVNNSTTSQTTGDTTPNAPTNPNSPVNNNGASGNVSTGLMNGNTGTTTTGGNQPNFTPATNTVGGQDATMATTGNVGGGSPVNNDGATQNFGQMAGITTSTTGGNGGTTTTADTTGANDVADQAIANNVAGSNYTPNGNVGTQNYTQHVDDGTTVLNDNSVNNLGGNMTGNHDGMNTHITRVHDHHTILNHNIHHQGKHYNPNAGTFGYSNLKPQSNGNGGLNFANLALKHKNDK